MWKWVGLGSLLVEEVLAKKYEGGKGTECRLAIPMLIIITAGILHTSERPCKTQKQPGHGPQLSHPLIYPSTHLLSKVQVGKLPMILLRRLIVSPPANRDQMLTFALQSIPGLGII